MKGRSPGAKEKNWKQDWLVLELRQPGMGVESGEKGWKYRNRRLGWDLTMTRELGFHIPNTKTKKGSQASTSLEIRMEAASRKDYWNIAICTNQLIEPENKNQKTRKLVLCLRRRRTVQVSKQVYSLKLYDSRRQNSPTAKTPVRGSR